MRNKTLILPLPFYYYYYYYYYYYLQSLLFGHSENHFFMYKEVQIIPTFHCPKFIVRVFMSIIIVDMHVLPKN